MNDLIFIGWIGTGLIKVYDWKNFLKLAFLETRCCSYFVSTTVVPEKMHSNVT